MKTIAAIDVGSNAIRLVIGAVDEDYKVRTIKTLRAPVRLGEDVFKTGFIEKGTAKKAALAFVKFKNFARKYNVKYIKAVATSAVREAANRREFIEYIALKSGVHLSLIDGDEEALAIQNLMTSTYKLQNKKCLLMDIGGGSIEIVLSNSGRLKMNKSFKLGTVRLLHEIKTKDPKVQEVRIQKILNKYRPFIKRYISQSFSGSPSVFIGTGGNIETLGRLRKKLLKTESVHFLTLKELNQLISHLQKMNYKQRIDKLKLRKDRADVIVPAALTLKMVLELSKAKKIFIPGLGLKDGILYQMAQKLKKPKPHISCDCWYY